MLGQRPSAFTSNVANHQVGDKHLWLGAAQGLSSHCGILILHHSQPLSFQMKSPALLASHQHHAGTGGPHFCSSALLDSENQPQSPTGVGRGDLSHSLR